MGYSLFLAALLPYCRCHTLSIASISHQVVRSPGNCIVTTMIGNFLFIWFILYLVKFLIHQSNIVKSSNVYYPFYISFEVDVIIKKLQEYLQIPYIYKTCSIIFNFGAGLMLTIIAGSPFLFIYLLSNIHFSSSYLVVNDEQKDSISSLIVPLVPYLNIPQSYFFSFWTSTILSALIHEIGYTPYFALLRFTLLLYYSTALLIT